MSITEFLLARLAEDEAAAKYAQTRGAPTDEDFGRWWLGHYQHVQRHNPDRVLAEVDAKRQIVEIAGHLRGVTLHGSPVEVGLLAPLAAVYADHPDYDESWRP